MFLRRVSYVVRTVAVKKEMMGGGLCHQQSAAFSRVRRTSKSRSTGGNSGDGSTAITAPPPSGVMDPADAWTEVRDKASGQLYWWNTVTDETTALGMPKPQGPSAMAAYQQPVGAAPGLGRVMAEGLAFGTGHAIAHGVIGSMLGGGGHHGGGGDAGGDVGGDVGDSFDI